MDTNPSSPANNRHHMGGYNSEDEFYDELLGRGPGDIDMTGYPEAEDGDS